MIFGMTYSGTMKAPPSLTITLF